MQSVESLYWCMFLKFCLGSSFVFHVLIDQISLLLCSIPLRFSTISSCLRSWTCLSWFPLFAYSNPIFGSTMLQCLLSQFSFAAVFPWIHVWTLPLPVYPAALHASGLFSVLLWLISWLFLFSVCSCFSLLWNLCCLGRHFGPLNLTVMAGLNQ